MARAPGVADSLGRRARVSARGVGARLPLVLMLDRSKSMRREGRGRALAETVGDWLTELRADRVLRRRVDLAVVTFGGHAEVEVLSLRSGTPAGFMPVDETEDIPLLQPAGSTPLGAAIDCAMQLCSVHVATLRTAGRDVYRPNLWIVTDGEPTDVLGHATEDWRAPVARLRAAEARDRLLVFAVGLRSANRSVLEQIAPMSHYLDPRLNLARALRFVSISSRETLGRGNQPSEQIYAWMRKQLGVDEHGNLRAPEDERR